MSLLRFEMKKLFLRPGAIIFVSFFMLILLVADVSNALYFMGGGKAKAQYEFARQYEGIVNEDTAKKAIAGVKNYQSSLPAGKNTDTFNYPANIKIYLDYTIFYNNLDIYLHGNINDNPQKPYSLDAITNRLEQLKSEGKVNSYDYKSLSKNLSMMNKLGEPEYRYLLPWESLLPALTAGGNIIINIFVLIVIIASVFSKEYSTGMDSIILSTKNGRFGIVIAKLTASIIFCFAFVVLYNLTQLLACLAVGGTYGWNSSIKSMNFFLYTPYNLSLIRFFAVQLVIQLLGCLVIVFTVVFVSSKIRSSLVTFFISLAIVFYPLIIGGYFPISAKWIQPILDINLIQMVRAYSIFTEYKDYNIFGIPVLYPYLLIPLCVLFGALMIILTFRTIKHREVY